MITEEDKKRILLIAYCFPPLGGVGTLRTLTLTKHLTEFGWYPHVLTVREGAGGQPKDSSLMANVPQGFEISRAGYWDVNVPLQILRKFFPSSWIAPLDQLLATLPPDRYVGWVPFAFSKALKIIAHNRVDIIYTADLYSTHLVGYLLRKTTGKTWIADIGDEWASNPFRSRLFPGQQKVENWIERKILGAANHIIIAWLGLTKLLLLHGKKECTTITCGFFSEDFESSSNGTTRGRDKFRITYTGSFYASQQPTYFLNAIQKLLDEGQISSDNIELVFVGRTRTDGLSGFANSSVANCIVCPGFVPHRRSVEYLMDSDILLLIVSAERGSGNIPGKTFEYIASGKPILALVPPKGAAADLIRKTNTGIVVASEDIAAIRDVVLDLYLRWKEGRLQIHPNWEEICQYEAKNLSKSLSEVLDRVLASGHPFRAPTKV